MTLALILAAQAVAAALLGGRYRVLDLLAGALLAFSIVVAFVQQVNP